MLSIKEEKKSISTQEKPSSEKGASTTLSQTSNESVDEEFKHKKG